MLRIAGQCYSPQLIVFDKDGTLVAFDELWHFWFDQLLRSIERQLPLSTDVRRSLAETLGYEPESNYWDPLGPLTLASTREVCLLIAGVLYRYADVDWLCALKVVTEAEMASRAELDWTLVKPIGNVKATLEALRQHGITLALATTDERESTKQQLRQLGIAELFAVIICGDDPVPLKPAPDMALWICRQVGIPPDRTLMVGDTVADLVMARKAGCMAAIGVCSGALSAELLAPYADAVIKDIHELEIVTGPNLDCGAIDNA